jgi:hypothetical protein
MLTSGEEMKLCFLIAKTVTGSRYSRQDKARIPVFDGESPKSSSEFGFRVFVTPLIH